MLSYVLVVAIAGWVAFAISSRSSSWWLTILGGFVGFIVGWAGGVLLATYLLDVLFDIDVTNTLVNLMTKGFSFALLAGALGAKAGRAKTAAKLPMWIVPTATVMCVLGVAMAIALPTYHDYKKRKFDPSTAVEVSRNDRVIDASPQNVRQRLAQPAQQPVVSQGKSSSDAKALEAHFRRIYAAHPDTDSLVAEPEFERWTSSGERKRIADSGTADEVIVLLSQYKTHKASLLDFANKPPQQVQPARAFQQQAPYVDLGSCEYKSVMTDADYAACGISPPGRG